MAVNMNTLHSFLFDGDVKNRALIKHKSITFSIVLFYVALVKVIIPALMKNRKPFDLRKVIITYSFSLSLINTICGYKLILLGIETWHVRCDIQHLPEGQYYMNKLLQIGWLVFLSKLVELFDTIFFALRKKENQISFLHVFHHSLIVILFIYVTTLNYIGYYVFFGITMNLWVHSVMYFYYGLAAFGPWIQKYLWWKKYLTLMQIMQFLIFLIYAFNGLMTGCENLGIFEVLLLSFVAIVLVLFIQFYIKSFSKKQS